MAKIARATFVQFGLSGPTADFAQYGSQAASAPIKSKNVATIQALTAWVNGWQDAVALGEAPYLEDMNGLLYVFSYMLAYLFQEGIPEYDSGTTYFIGGIVKNLGNSGYVEFYSSLTDTNVGNALPTRADNTNWSFLYALHQANSQIIYGKSIAFSSTSTLGVVGTTTNNNAAAGNVGEYIEGVVTGNTNAAATGTYDDGTSIALTAGDWDVSAMAIFDANGATWTAIELGISATSGNSGTGLVGSQNDAQAAWASTTNVPSAQTIAIPSYRISIASPTTYYLKRKFSFSAGTPRTNSMRLSARRVR